MTDDRTPPKRIRLSGLQEAQLAALVEVERRTAAMYHAIGFDAAEVPPRSTSDLVKLTRDHDVKVAEADHVVAGYAAWSDEEPGVAYVDECSVHPDFQRFGVGTHLIHGIFEAARAARLEQATVKCWKKATWAFRFYSKLGFVEIDENAPAKVKGWRDVRASSGRPIVRPGELVLWAAIPPAPKVDDDDETESEPADEG